MMSMIAALFIIAALTTNEPARPIKSLTMSECIERALANNLDLQVERFNPRIAAWGVVGAQSVYDPLVGSTVNYANDVQPPGTFRTESLSIAPGVSGKLPSGATYDLTAFDSRTLVTNASLLGSAGASVTQPLLRN